MNSNNIWFHTINEYICNWLLDQITQNRQWHACSQCQLGDSHRVVIDWNTYDTEMKLTSIGTRDQIIKCNWFYVWRQFDSMVGYSAECFSQIIVDVQCWCLIWTGVTLGSCQRSIVPPKLHYNFGWGWGTTGVHGTANCRGWYQGCQRGGRTGLSPWCTIRGAMGGIVSGQMENK